MRQLRCAFIGVVLLPLLILTAWIIAASPPAFAFGTAPQVEQSPKAPCAICSVREKAGPEAVAATWEYEGRTYSFCSEACKTEFQQDPKKWLKLAHAGEGTGPKKAPSTETGVDRSTRAPSTDSAAPS